MSFRVSLSTYCIKNQQMQLWQCCLLVTARSLYMFRKLPASIIRSTKNGINSHWCMSWVGMIYRVSQEECARLREGVPYVKVYRYNPKHLCPKLNGYGDNDQRKVWSSGRSTHYTCQLTALSMLRR